MPPCPGKAGGRRPPQRHLQTSQSSCLRHTSKAVCDLLLTSSGDSVVPSQQRQALCKLRDRKSPAAPQERRRPTVGDLGDTGLLGRPEGPFHTDQTGSWKQVPRRCRPLLFLDTFYRFTSCPPTQSHCVSTSPVLQGSLSGRGSPRIGVHENTNHVTSPLPCGEQSAPSWG